MESNNIFYGITFPENFQFVDTESRKRLALLLLASPDTSAIKAKEMIENQELISKLNLLIQNLQLEILTITSEEIDDAIINKKDTLKAIFKKLNQWNEVFQNYPTSEELNELCVELKVHRNIFDLEYRKFCLSKSWSPVLFADCIKEVVKGQDSAVKVLSIALDNFKARLSNNNFDHITPLFMGETGNGKSLMCGQAGEIFSAKYLKIDCANLSPEGYKGLRISDYFEGVDPNSPTIVHYDEVDKLCYYHHRKNSSSDYKTSIMNEILPHFDNKPFTLKADEQKILIKPKNNQYIFSGAFSGIEDIIYARLLNEFDKNSKLIDTNNILSYCTPEDLQKYGLKKELCGRLSYICALNKLTVTHIYSILTDSSESALKKHQEILKNKGVKLEITERGLWEISRIVYESNLGARYINTLLIQLLEDVHFSNEKSIFTIDEQYILFKTSSNKYRLLFNQFKTTKPDLLKIADTFSVPVDFVLDHYSIYKKFNH